MDIVGRGSVIPRGREFHFPFLENKGHKQNYLIATFFSLFFTLWLGFLLNKKMHFSPNG